MEKYENYQYFLVEISAFKYLKLLIFIVFGLKIFEWSLFGDIYWNARPYFLLKMAFKIIADEIQNIFSKKGRLNISFELPT